MKMKSINAILFSICVLFLLLPPDIPGQTRPEDLMGGEFVTPTKTTIQENEPQGEERLKAQIITLKKELLAQESKYSFYAVIAICVLSLITLLLTLLFLNRSQFSASANDIVNAIGLIIIVFGTIILVLVSETEQQITAAIGILGAIAGYLFGTMQLGRRGKS
ncbi:MAG: hypothetical protein HWN70_02405 [Desulfobacterales bacterium]|nr:hypothetical protein [Desulfobacterales bacterium]